MSVNLEEIKAVKNFDQLKKLVGKSIISRKKFVGRYEELEFLGRFMAIAASESAYGIQAKIPSEDYSRVIRFCDAIRRWYASGHIDNSIYQLEALKVLSEGWYLDLELPGRLKEYEFGGYNTNRDPTLFFDSTFGSLERLNASYYVNILPQLKVALIYEEMDVYYPKFHYKIESKFP